MEIYYLVVVVDKHLEGKFNCSDLLCDFLYLPMYYCAVDFHFVVTTIAYRYRWLPCVSSAHRANHTSTYSVVEMFILLAAHNIVLLRWQCVDLLSEGLVLHVSV